jgi:hypothetical protein
MSEEFLIWGPIMNESKKQTFDIDFEIVSSLLERSPNSSVRHLISSFIESHGNMNDKWIALMQRIKVFLSHDLKELANDIYVEQHDDSLVLCLESLLACLQATKLKIPKLADTITFFRETKIPWWIDISYVSKVLDFLRRLAKAVHALTCYRPGSSKKMCLLS